MPVGIVGILAARSKRKEPVHFRPAHPSQRHQHTAALETAGTGAAFLPLLPECRNCNAEILQRDAMPSGGRDDIWYLSSLSRTPASVACAQK